MKTRFVGVVIVLAGIMALAGCGGGSGGSQPTEHELLSQTEERLYKYGFFHRGGEDLIFSIPSGGTCTINWIAVGVEAPSYEGYPWTVESPDGEVAIKSSAEQGALTEDCNAVIEQAMGW